MWKQLRSVLCSLQLHTYLCEKMLDDNHAVATDNLVCSFTLIFEDRV